MFRPAHQLPARRLFCGSKVGVAQRRRERSSVIPRGDLYSARARLADVCKAIGCQVIDDEIAEIALKCRYRNACVGEEEMVVADLSAATALRLQIGIAEEREIELANLRRPEGLAVRSTKLVATVRPRRGHARRCFAAKRVVMIPSCPKRKLERPATESVFDKERLAGPMVRRNVEPEAVA